MARDASVKPTNTAPVNPRYRAPEALTDPNMHTKESDVFMFGCIMWEIFTRTKVSSLGSSQPQHVMNVSNRRNYSFVFVFCLFFSSQSQIFYWLAASNDLQGLLNARWRLAMENGTARNCLRQLKHDLVMFVPLEVLLLMIKCLNDDPIQRPSADELLATINRAFLSLCIKNPDVVCGVNLNDIEDPHNSEIPKKWP